MAFDVQKAQQAGYSNDKIIQYLNQTRGGKFDVQGARTSGYSDDKIIGYLSTVPKAKEIKPVVLPQTPAPDYGGEIMKSGKNLVNQAISPVQNVIDTSGNQSTFSKALRGASAGIEGATSVPLSLLGSGLNAITGGVAGKIGTGISNVLGTGISAAIDKVPEQYKATFVDMVQKYPELAQDAGALANLVLTFAGSAAGKMVSEKVGDVIGSQLLKKGIQASKEVAPKVAGSITNATNKTVDITKAKLASRGLTKKINTITETITPKPTVKEARLATSEGRLIKGKSPTLFREGKPDSVIPSKKTSLSAKTIEKYIPNAHKMDEAKLYTATEKKVTQIAKTLEPVMQQTKLTKENIKSVNSDWEKLKEKQLSSADASEEENVKKMHRQFQERLEKVYGGGVSKTIEQGRKEGWNGEKLRIEVEKKVSKQENANLDNLWKERISYDSSIPENVKKANQMSSESLQNKREIWLQNRSVFTDAIKREGIGLDKKYQKFFSDMEDLYNAQSNLMSKSKIEDKIDPSKLKQFISKHPIVSSAVGGYVVDKTIKGFTGFGY